MTRTVQEEVSDSLDDFFSQRHSRTHSRNVAVVQYHYGFGGAAEPTLEAAADRFGITRQRVEQILGSARSALPRAALSSVDAIVELVSTSPSWLNPELVSLLVESDLVEEPFSISGLLRLAKDTGRVVDYTICPPDLSGPTKRRKRERSADWVGRIEEKHEAFLILNRERVSHAKRLLTHARKFHKKYGLARVDHVLDEPECSDIPDRQRILGQLLQASEDAWVGSDGGATWYLFEDQQHVLKNVAKKVFSVTDTCNSSDLAEACSRELAGRKGKAYPHSPASRPLIRRYFETSTAFEAVDGQVRYSPEAPARLRAVEEDLVACLKASPKGATGAEIGAYLAARGHKKASIHGATGKSPLARPVGERAGPSGYTYYLIGTGPNESSSAVGTVLDESYVRCREALDRLAQTDEDAEVKIRNEQEILRRWLFKGKNEERCALCGRIFTVRHVRRPGADRFASALVAAHKKKRRLCNPAERRDPHIVMPLCVFGCDFVYEHRHVVVRDGVAVRGDLESCSRAVRKYVEGLEGRKICDRWLAGKPWYFDDADRFSIQSCTPGRLSVSGPAASD